MKHRGIIIFISGYPGTGKSRLAQRIVKAYPEFKVISYDVYKERYWDDYGFDDEEEKQYVNKLSRNGYMKQLSLLMKQQENIITEYPFYTAMYKARFEKMVEENDYLAISILLQGDMELIYQQFTARNNRPRRHPAYTLNRYHKKSYDPSQAKRKILTYEEFLESVKGRDYDLKIGRSYYYDIADYSKIDLDPLLKYLEEVKNE